MQTTKALTSAPIYITQTSWIPHNMESITYFMTAFPLRVMARLNPQSSQWRNSFLISASRTSHSVDWNKLSISILQYRNSMLKRWTITSSEMVWISRSGQPTSDDSQMNGKSFEFAKEAARNQQEKSRQLYNLHAHNLHFTLVIMLVSKAYIKGMRHFLHHHSNWAISSLLHQDSIRYVYSLEIVDSFTSFSNHPSSRLYIYKPETPDEIKSWSQKDHPELR